MAKNAQGWRAKPMIITDRDYLSWFLPILSLPSTAKPSLRGILRSVRMKVPAGYLSKILALLTRAPGYLLQAGPGAMDAQVFADLAAQGRGLAVRDPDGAFARAGMRPHLS